VTVPATVTRRWVSIDDVRWTQAHASTVVRTGGATLAAWFAGTREGTPDNRIWLSRRADDQDSWDDPVAVTDEAVAHWNPVLAPGPDGALWLLYKKGARISAWATWFRRSTDGGRTWRAAAELVPGDEGGRGPVKNPPLLLADGTWLAPGSVERWEGCGSWECFVDLSTDAGRTWTASPVPLDRSALRGAGVIQPALWQADGGIHALMRSTEGRAFLSRSTDGGRTWSPAAPTALANNNSALTVVALPDGRVACVHNPVSGDWGVRCPLSVSVSADGGRSWTERITVEDGRTPIDADPARAPQPPPGERMFDAGDGGVLTSGVGEYSYPSAVLDPEHEQLVITYSWQRRGIVEARVPLSRL
jgi:predicted neuraminidase